MKILSIIVPSYNTEYYISKNIPTFLDDGILDKIEILIINDGSVDNTETIARKWEKNYPETIRVISKSNGGHGSVINCGVEAAKGKYFKVIDGDDWVDTKGLAALVKYLEKCEIDLVINPYYRVDEKSKKYRLIDLKSVHKSQRYEFDDVVGKVKYIPLHAWTIKTSILLNNSIKVTEKCYYEDFEYVIYPVPYVKTVIFLGFPVYCYLVGQQNQSVSDRNVLKNAYMHETIIRNAIRFYENNNTIGKKGEYIYLNILNLIKSHYNIYLRNYCIGNAYGQMLEFDKRLLEISPAIYKAVSERYQYIKYIRKSKSLFMVAAICLMFLKKMDIRGL